MQRTQFRSWKAATAAALVLASGAAAWTTIQSTLTPYDELTNTYRTTANFNVETVRGLHVAPSGRVLMINTHGSTLNMWAPRRPSQPPACCAMQARFSTRTDATP